MDSVTVIQRLRAHEPELKAAGIVHLRLFGSIARGNQTSESDVDLLVDLDRSKLPTLVTVSKLRRRLTDLLGIEVDLSSADWMKEPVRGQVVREALHVF